MTRAQPQTCQIDVNSIRMASSLAVLPRRVLKREVTFSMYKLPDAVSPRMLMTARALEVARAASRVATVIPPLLLILSSSRAFRGVSQGRIVRRPFLVGAVARLKLCKEFPVSMTAQNDSRPFAAPQLKGSFGNREGCVLRSTLALLPVPLLHAMHLHYRTPPTPVPHQSPIPSRLATLFA